MFKGNDIRPFESKVWLSSKSTIVSLHFRGNIITLSGMNTSDASAENLPFELKKVIGM